MHVILSKCSGASVEAVGSTLATIQWDMVRSKTAQLKAVLQKQLALAITIYLRSN